MDYIKPTPRNMIGPVADALRGGKEFLNKPGKLMGVGIGDLLLGEAPEMLDNASYGQSPFSHGKGMTTRMDPGLVDAALLPGMASLPALLRKGAGAVASAPAAAVDMGRRAALGNIGKGAVAAGMTASSIPHVLSALKAAPSKAMAAEAAPAAARAAAVGMGPAVKAALAKGLDNIFTDFGSAEKALNPDQAIELARKALGPDMGSEDIAEGYMRMMGTHGEGPYGVTPESMEMGIKWDELSEKGINTTEELLDSLFRGKVQPKELAEEVLEDLNNVIYARRPSSSEPTKGKFEELYSNIFGIDE